MVQRATSRDCVPRYTPSPPSCLRTPYVHRRRSLCPTHDRVPLRLTTFRHVSTCVCARILSPLRVIAHLKTSPALALVTACGGMLPRIFVNRRSRPAQSLCVAHYGLPRGVFRHIFRPRLAVDCLLTSFCTVVCNHHPSFAAVAFFVRHGLSAPAAVCRHTPPSNAANYITPLRLFRIFSPYGAD